MMKSMIVFSLLLIGLAASQALASPNLNCPKLGALGCDCPNFPAYCITTGNKEFTYFKIGENLVDYIAPKAGVDLQVVEGGSLDNIKKVRWQNGVIFAIVQSDVLEFYRNSERKGNLGAANLLRPLRVVLPLYQEEVHLITQADSNINHFRDLYGKRIALGEEGGGSAKTGPVLYKLMFGEPLAKDKIHFSGFNNALRAVVNREVDAWIMVVGQPAERFSKLSSDAKQMIKLVKFDAENKIESKILEGPYFQGKIQPKSKVHPNGYSWLSQEVSTVTVQAFLITQEQQKRATQKKITQFTQALCKHFPTLQERGHAKWKEVELAYKRLPGGWAYSKEVKEAFQSRDCSQMAGVPPRPNPVRPKILAMPVEPACPKEYALVGLCK